MTVINVAPVITGISVDSAVINEDGSATVTGTITDVGTLDTHSVEIDWGGSEGTSAATVTQGSGSASFTATHQYLDDDPTATSSDDYTITATVTDDDGGTDTATVDITVNNVAPVLSGVGVTRATIEGSNFQVSGTITDPGTLDTFFVDVDFGDGTGIHPYPLPAGTTDFTLDYQYPDDNPSTTPVDLNFLTVTVRDDDTGTSNTEADITWVFNAVPTFTNVAVTTSINESDTATLTGTVNDVGIGDTFALVVDWGDDGGAVTYPLPASPTGTQDFEFTHQYFDRDLIDEPVDQYTIALTVTDDDGGNAVALRVLTVYNVAPTVVAGGDQAADEGDTVNVTATFTDPSPYDLHTATIDWGDGTVTEVTVTEGGGSGSVSGSHVYEDDGIFAATITVTDDDGYSSSDTFTVTVSNVAPALALDPVSAIDENDVATLTGSITDPGTLDTFTVTVDWADGSPVEIFSYDAGTTTFTETHQYLDDDPSGTPSDNYNIAVTVSDDDLGTDSANAVVTVNNVASELVNMAVTSPIDEDDVATLTGDIIDPGTLDTFALTVDWGDGSALETFNYPAGTTSFSETHQYLDDDPSGTGSDTYNVTATLADDDGTSGGGGQPSVLTTDNTAIDFTAPTGNGTGVGPQQVRGWEFEATSTITISHLGWYDTSSSGTSDGLLRSHDIGLWASDGSLLASATLPSGSSGTEVGRFRYVPISTPVVLTAGSSYVIAGTEGPDAASLRDNGENLVNVASKVSIDPSITIINGRVVNSGTLVYPSGVSSISGSGGAWFGPSFGSGESGGWRHRNRDRNGHRQQRRPRNRKYHGHFGGRKRRSALDRHVQRPRDAGYARVDDRLGRRITPDGCRQRRFVRYHASISGRQSQRYAGRQLPDLRHPCGRRLRQRHRDDQRNRQQCRTGTSESGRNRCRRERGQCAHGDLRGSRNDGRVYRFRGLGRWFAS